MSLDDEYQTSVDPPSPTPKRPRTAEPPAQYQHDTDPIRTSSLSSPTMQLTGHKGSIYTLQFDPTHGETLLSGSFDMTCLLWNASGDCTNYNVLKGHKNAILDARWTSNSENIVTASADTNLGWWDAPTAMRVKQMKDHSGIVNAVDVVKQDSPHIAASGSDDATARLWDARVRGSVGLLEHDYQVTAVAFNLDGTVLYTGGIDNCILAWDVRQTNRKMMKMTGHTDTVTNLSLHPKGTHLLSNSMDNSLRTWDIRPFYAGKNRQQKTFRGGTHNAEKGLLNCAWSSDGTMISGGSADRVVHIWDEESEEELYYLPGHKGCVNCVAFHPRENMVASGGSDKTIFVGELS